MSSPTVPIEFRNVKKGDIILNEHVIVGANSIILPNVILSEGSVIGANSLVGKSTKEWTIYGGSPIIELKKRNKECAELCKNIII